MNYFENKTSKSEGNIIKLKNHHNYARQSNLIMNGFEQMINDCLEDEFSNDIQNEQSKWWIGDKQPATYIQNKSKNLQKTISKTKEIKTEEL